MIIKPQWGAIPIKKDKGARPEDILKRGGTKILFCEHGLNFSHP